MKSTRLTLLLLTLFTSELFAQDPVLYSRPSQLAKVFQRVGTTDIEVVYHAPLAKDRKIFGGIVPYDEKINGKDHPWRAGANENTTISFTHDVIINGQALSAGTYGLHIFVSEKEWRLAFSKRYEDWGSFTYSAEEDALRVKVKPDVAPMQNWLSYQFSNPEPDNVTLSLHWETAKVSFRISTNVDKNRLSDLEKIEEKNANHLYMMASIIINLDSTKMEEAFDLINKSLALEQKLGNRLFKSELLLKNGDKREAKKLKEEAIASATANELFSYAMKLNNEKDLKGSMRILKLNLEKNPDHWFSHLGFANYYMTRDEYGSAIPYFEEALKLAPEQGKGFATYRLGFAKSKLDN